LLCDEEVERFWKRELFREKRGIKMLVTFNNLLLVSNRRKIEWRN